MKRIIIICLLASGVIFGQSIPTSHGRYVSGTLSPGQLITFSGSLSHDNDIINELCTPRYEWDFIFNGTFSANISTTSATVNYTYPNAGLFTVAMKYYDNDCQAGNIYTFTIEIVGLTRYYYIKDQLGSVRITMNQQGNVVSGQDYYPYGEICRSLNNADPNDKYKFTEKERDVETNFDYFGARYFDSQISRWLSVDPMADLRPGLSPYNYCQNNPLRRIDPTGMLDQAGQATSSDEAYKEYLRELALAGKEDSEKEKNSRNKTNPMFPTFNPFHYDRGVRLATAGNDVIDNALGGFFSVNNSVGNVADGVSAWAYLAAGACVGGAFFTDGATLAFVPDLLGVGLVSDATSLVSKQIDASFNGGSQEKANIQLTIVAVDAFGGYFINNLATRFAVRTGFTVGPLFRGANGRFVSNNFGVFIEAVRDATNVSSGTLINNILKNGE